LLVAGYFLYSTIFTNKFIAPNSNASEQTSLSISSQLNESATAVFSVKKAYAKLSNDINTKAKGSTREWVAQIWTYCMSLVNILVIAVLIFLAFVNILRIQYDTYMLKKVLPTLILAVILANFSLFTCRMVVDFSEVLTRSIIVPNPTSKVVAMQDFENAKLLLAQRMTDAMGVKILGYAGGIEEGMTHVPVVQMLAPASKFVSIILLTIIGFVLMGIVFILVLFLALVLWVRIPVVLFLAAISPLAFMAMVLPVTQGYFKQWWGQFLKWTFMLPITLFLFRVVSLFGVTGDFDITAYVVSLAVMYYAVQLPFKMGNIFGFDVIGKMGSSVRALTGTGKGGYFHRKGQEWVGMKKKNFWSKAYENAFTDKSKFEPLKKGTILKGLGQRLSYRTIGALGRGSIKWQQQQELADRALERTKDQGIADFSEQNLAMHDRAVAKEKLAEQLKAAGDRLSQGTINQADYDRELASYKTAIKEINRAGASRKIKDSLTLSRTKLLADNQVVRDVDSGYHTYDPKDPDRIMNKIAEHDPQFPNDPDKIRLKQHWKNFFEGRGYLNSIKDNKEIKETRGQITKAMREYGNDPLNVNTRSVLGDIFSRTMGAHILNGNAMIDRTTISELFRSRTRYAEIGSSLKPVSIDGVINFAGNPPAGGRPMPMGAAAAGTTPRPNFVDTIQWDKIKAETDKGIADVERNFSQVKDEVAKIASAPIEQLEDYQKQIVSKLHDLHAQTQSTEIKQALDPIIKAHVDPRFTIANSPELANLGNEEKAQIQTLMDGQLKDQDFVLRVMDPKIVAHFDPKVSTVLPERLGPMLDYDGKVKKQLKERLLLEKERLQTSISNELRAHQITIKDPLGKVKVENREEVLNQLKAKITAPNITAPIKAQIEKSIKDLNSQFNQLHHFESAETSIKEIEDNYGKMFGDMGKKIQQGERKLNANY